MIASTRKWVATNHVHFYQMKQKSWKIKQWVLNYIKIDNLWKRKLTPRVYAIEKEQQRAEPIFFIGYSLITVLLLLSWETECHTSFLYRFLLAVTSSRKENFVATVALAWYSLLLQITKVTLAIKQRMANSSSSGWWFNCPPKMGGENRCATLIRKHRVQLPKTYKNVNEM